MHKSPHCIRDRRTNCGACRGYPSNGDSLDQHLRGAGLTTWSFTLLNIIRLRENDFPCFVHVRFLITELSLILFLKLTELDFSKENCHWFLRRWQCYTFFCLLGFFSVSSNCISDLSILMPKLLADWTQLSGKYMRQSEVRVTLWMKNKSCWRALNVYAPCVQHTKISLW